MYHNAPNTRIIPWYLPHLVEFFPFLCLKLSGGLCGLWLCGFMCDIPVYLSLLKLHFCFFISLFSVVNFLVNVVYASNMYYYYFLVISHILFLYLIYHHE